MLGRLSTILLYAAVLQCFCGQIGASGEIQNPNSAASAENKMSAVIVQSELGKETLLQVGRSVHIAGENIRVDFSFLSGDESSGSGVLELVCTGEKLNQAGCGHKQIFSLNKSAFRIQVWYWKGLRFALLEIGENEQNVRQIKFRADKEENAEPLAEFLIDGRKVSEKEFESFKNSLKEIHNTWSCAKTNRGGIVRYKAADSTGRVYLVKTVSEPGLESSSILLQKTASVPEKDLK